MPLEKLDSFTKKVQDLADKPNATMSAAEVKAQFDAAPDEVRQYLNKLIDDLSSVADGDSGADNLGATAIAGLTGITVQAILESLKALDDTNRAQLVAQIQGVTLGQIPDGSITEEKLAFEIATNAESVSVTDVAGHFTGTNVETVLNELFTFANNGKTDIASVVGSPAIVGDTFTQLKTHIQTRKNKLATNLSAKGQTSVGTETLDVLVDKVSLVNTGKKDASGTATSSVGSSSFTDGGNSAVSYPTLTVTGLTFTPSIIEISLQSGETQSITYSADLPTIPITMTTARTSVSPSSDTIKLLASVVVNGTGFTMPVFNPNVVHKWKAKE